MTEAKGTNIKFQQPLILFLITIFSCRDTVQYQSSLPLSHLGALITECQSGAHALTWSFESYEELTLCLDLSKCLRLLFENLQEGLIGSGIIATFFIYKISEYWGMINRLPKLLCLNKIHFWLPIGWIAFRVHMTMQLLYCDLPGKLGQHYVWSWQSRWLLFSPSVQVSILWLKNI